MNRASQLQFAHRCSLLLDSGISLSEAISIMMNMEKSRKNLLILGDIRKSVEKGISLSKSIVLTGARFDRMLVSMISFGESSGILALSLRQARETLEKSSTMKKKLIGALIYPGFIALATAGMTLFLVMYIFPKIIPLFSSMNIELPLITRAVRMLYELLLAYGLWTITITLFLVVIFIALYKKKIVIRKKTHLILLRAPLLGITLQKYVISADCRSIATLLECGQSLPAVLGHIAASSTLVPYSQAWTASRAETTRGVPLSASLRSCKTIFPSLVPDMLSIGERTGSLTAMFEHVSRIYEEELDSFVKQLSTSIEPVLMIGMGLIVGSVALSIILPIYEITNHLTK